MLLLTTARKEPAACIYIPSTAQNVLGKSDFNWVVV